ncbi:DUF2141 domain-containing protein [Draconibacterium sp. IB214405]|uniref:DUF2141 domain-containing protein n=1 Tax=Draconibacterium sp. IB214405 TaxID=3097352 RepID=UPI002A1328C5|nr:DUF2141 domain-containing protein [Draconibacterium sp. IB214405]MDX8341147.1 DUF2141 domain-containing protein [Draconibacterium sp. IB214405]
MRFFKFLVVVCLSIIGQYAHGQSTTLIVTVPNINPLKGEIQVSVYDNDESFLKENEEYKIYRFKVEEAKGSFVINDLPEKEYALIIYHDENDNKKMDKSIIGMPKEGYGFSKNVKPGLSRPDFKDCSILLNKDVETEIKLMY